LTGALISTSTAPLNFQGNSNTGTYNPTVIYFNQNNTSGNTANGVFIERGRLTDSSSAEVRYFVIGARGGSIQWQVDGAGNTTQAAGLSATSAVFSSTVTANSIIIPGFETATNVLSFRSGIPDGINVGIRAKAITTSNRDGLELLGYNGIDFSINNGSIVAMHINGQGATGPGNVGIGTTSPVGALHIYSSNQNMASSAATSYSNAKFRLEPFNTSSVGISMGLISPNINYIQSSYNEGTTSPLTINPFGGNLAIGTTTATWKLSVANEAVIGAQGGSDYTYISGGSGYGSVIRSYYATGAINNEIRGNGNNYFNVLLGSMGVGTNNPLYTLDVNGTGRFVGNLYANNKLYTSTVIGGNLVAGNISSNMPSAPAYILIVDLNNIAGFSLSGKVNAASYTCWNISDIWIQKNYSSTTASAGIEGKYKSGCDFSIVNINYGAGNYIALRFTSNPEIDVLWTGYRLTDQVSGGAFQVITSGVTVNSTYASY
jgi:hypothetical protein